MSSDAIINAGVGAFVAAEQVETGLVTAAVIAGDPIKLTPEGKEAAKGLLNLKDVELPKLAQLAREIAQDVHPLPVLLNKHGLTQNQYDFLLENNDFFKNAVAQECKDWQSIGSTEKRLRLQALAALEEKFPVLASRMGSAAEKLSDVVEAFKLVAKVAGVDAAVTGAAAGGSGFSITIDLGADTRITVGPPPLAGEDTSAGSAAPPLRDVSGKPAGDVRALQPLPKG